jgi:6-phosphofructokinase
VTLDGDLVFSKRALGRHTAPGEVVEIISQRRGG